MEFLAFVNNTKCRICAKYDLKEKKKKGTVVLSLAVRPCSVGRDINTRGKALNPPEVLVCSACGLVNSIPPASPPFVKATGDRCIFFINQRSCQ